MGVDYTTYGRKEAITDVVVCILFLAGFYACFAGLLFIASFLLLSIWEVTWLHLLLYAIAPTVICEAFFVITLIRKRKKEAEMREYTQRRD